MCQGENTRACGIGSDIIQTGSEIILQCHKKKINTIIRKREGIGNYFAEEEMHEEAEPKQVVKEKVVDLPILSVDEAILQLELLDHDFFMFINEEDHKPTTIYLRNDGNYAIIRTK